MGSIVAERVSYRYGATVALSKIDFQVDPGEMVFLQGQNGAGKSTLLALLGTLTRPSSGKIRWGSFGSNAVAARSQLGWLGHDSRCYGALSPKENLEFAARLYGMAPEPVAQLIHQFSLKKFSERPFDTLSRGQKQRVSLARALVNDPSWLLLDEPLTGLDFASVDRLAVVLHQLKDAGKGIVLVSHERDFAARFNARTVHLHQGKIIDAAHVDAAYTDAAPSESI